MKLHNLFSFICLLASINLSAQDTPRADSTVAHALVFERVEVEAAFPGDEKSWRAYLMKNLKINTPVDHGAPAGRYRVVVLFVVSRDGTISGVKAETDFGYGMEQEVMRVIAKSGGWSPARQNGRAVNAYRRQPVTFTVEEEGYEMITKIPFTLFTGIDNKIEVNIRKIKNENITLTISQGSIEATADGQFIARVNNPGQAIITVYNKKNNKTMGATSFEVTTKK